MARQWPTSTNAMPVQDTHSIFDELDDLEDVSPEPMEMSIQGTSPDYDSPATIPNLDYASRYSSPLDHAHDYDPISEQWPRYSPIQQDMHDVLGTFSMLDDPTYTTPEHGELQFEDAKNESIDTSRYILHDDTNPPYAGQYGSNVRKRKRLGDFDDLLIFQPRNQYRTVNDNFAGLFTQNRSANIPRIPQARTNLDGNHLSPMPIHHPPTNPFVPDQQAGALHPSFSEQAVDSSNFPTLTRSTTQPVVPPLPFLPPNTEADGYLTRYLSEHRAPVQPVRSGLGADGEGQSLMMHHRPVQEGSILADLGYYGGLVDATSVPAAPIGSDKRTRSRRGLIRDADEDKKLVELRNQGLSYKEIKKRLKFRGAESTLRGRARTLTKTKLERPRKPQWTKRDIDMLDEAVQYYVDLRRKPNTNISIPLEESIRGLPWKRIADRMVEHGCHRFGNFTVKNKYCEIKGLPLIKNKS